MKMIEKVARAAHTYAVSVGAVSPQWIDYDKVPKPHKDHLLNTCKAIILAMLKPTEEMMATNDPVAAIEMVKVYQAMIRKALEE